jgi:cytochrome c553
MLSDKTRYAVLDRDGFACQKCGKALEWGKHQCHVHHLNYDSDNLENLISLCVRCHKNTDHAAINRPPNYYPKMIIAVSKDTHKRLMHLIREFQAERDESLNQDDIVREALDALEEKRKGNGKK